MRAAEAEAACHGCAMGKHTGLPHTASQSIRPQNVGEIIKMDLCGPMKVISRTGGRNFLLMVDDASNHFTVDIISTRHRWPHW
ncbi:TPA: hypothetical protein N0F65_009492 [Lagenidium giganteum]|uniref:Uncharacterized protein n=1 Tax=Lagenidium giganteum TaxID=4803 RepID=A0AAV2ZGQ7_9STRA|nr:TPA: hypothetical protein N0F65_009492 [Lagenidium giganteum]